MPIIPVCKKAFSFILETIAPKDPEIKALEELDFEDFDSKVQKNIIPHPDKHILCLYSYKDLLVKKAILEVKSYGNKTVAKLLGKAVCKTICESPFDIPLLIPIPMTQKSLRERGWNQCILIAKGAKSHDVDNRFEFAPKMLKKIRTTGDQVGKSREERFLNLKNCFQAELQVKDRDVIILDDICTTGATLKEAKRALESAGARSILCIALAH